jgi:hypothetical protein
VSGSQRSSAIRTREVLAAAGLRAAPGTRMVARLYRPDGLHTGSHGLARVRRTRSLTTRSAISSTCASGPSELLAPLRHRLLDGELPRAARGAHRSIGTRRAARWRGGRRPAAHRLRLHHCAPLRETGVRAGRARLRRVAHHPSRFALPDGSCSAARVRPGRPEGRVHPLQVVGTAGTVDVGAVDDLASLADLASGIAAPSTTTIQGRLAIRAALVNHRTEPPDLDALIEATSGRSARGRADPSARPGRAQRRQR